MLQSVDSAGSVLAVIGADADSIQLLSLQHSVAALVAADAFQAIVLAELLSLAGNQVSSGDDLNVFHLLVANSMSLSDPAGTDDTNLHLLAIVSATDFFDNALETIQNILCHNNSPFNS